MNYLTNLRVKLQELVRKINTLGFKFRIPSMVIILFANYVLILQLIDVDILVTNSGLILSLTPSCFTYQRTYSTLLFSLHYIENICHVKVIEAPKFLSLTVLSSTLLASYSIIIGWFYRLMPSDAHEDEVIEHKLYPEAKEPQNNNYNSLIVRILFLTTLTLPFVFFYYLYEFNTREIMLSDLPDYYLWQQMLPAVILVFIAVLPSKFFRFLFIVMFYLFQIEYMQQFILAVLTQPQTSP